MKVGELIAQLQDLDPALTVLLSRDDQLNGTHTCFGVGLYRRTEDGELKLDPSRRSPEMERQGYGDEDFGDPADELVAVI